MQLFQLINCSCLMLFTFLPNDCLSLDCYFGHGDDLSPVDCSRSQECRSGVQCMCLKVQGSNQEGGHYGSDFRSCWANPHGGQRPGCFTRYFRGDPQALVCTCDDADLCNGARKCTTGTLYLLIMITLLAIHLNS